MASPSDNSPNTIPASDAAALDALPLPAWISLAGSGRVFLNRHWLEFTGRTRAEEAGDGWRGGVHPDDRARVEEEIDRAVKANRPFSVDYRLKHHSGSYWWVCDRGAPRIDERGKVQGYSGACIEKAATTTFGTGDLDTLLFNSIDEAVVALSVDGTITRWSESATRLYGYRAEEVVGHKLQDFPMMEVPEDRAAAILESIQRKEPWSGEFVATRPDGSSFLLSSKVTPVLNSDGEVVGLLTLSRDVSEQRRTEGLLARLGRVMDESINEIYVFDERTLHFLQVNRGARENLGYTMAELEELTPLDLKPHFDAESYNALVGPLRSGERTQVIFETVQRRKDGSLYPVEVHLSLTRTDRPVFLAIILDITERKQIEEGLQRVQAARDELLLEIESQRLRLDGIVESIPGVVWEVVEEPDGSQQVDYVSRYIERITGYTVEETTSPDFWLSVIHPEDRDRVIAEAARADAGRVGTSQFRWITKDGRTIWVSAYSMAVMDAQGNVLGRRGVTLDINEQKRAEEALSFLAESGRMLSSSLDYGATVRAIARLVVPRLADWCAVAVLDEHDDVQMLTVEHSDPAKVEYARQLLTRYPPDSSNRFGLMHVIRTGESQMIPEVEDQMLQALARDEEHLRVLRELQVCSYMCTPLMARGRVLGAVIFVSSESGRRFDERDLDLAQHMGRRAGVALDNARLYSEVERERARFASMVASVEYGVLQLDGGGRLNYMNPAAEEILGYRLEDITHQSFHQLVHGRNPDGTENPEEKCQVLRVLQEGRAYSGREHYQRSDGSFIPVELNCAPMIAEGHIFGAVLVFTDISERLKQERMKDDFIAFASHELRTPLTSVFGLVKWLGKRGKRGDSIPEDIAGAVEMLDSETERMAQIVDLFLDLSRIESGRFALELGDVDLRALVQAEVERVKSRHPAVEFVLDVPDEPVPAVSDDVRTRQVLSNLLDNAAKYGGDTGRVEVRLVSQGQQAEIHVRDFGPGIAWEDQARIFDRFYRGQTGASRKGLGVGLFLSREIVDRLGGSLDFTSEPGQGTEFVVRLPTNAPGLYANQ